MRTTHVPAHPSQAEFKLEDFQLQLLTDAEITITCTNEKIILSWINSRDRDLVAAFKKDAERTVDKTGKFISNNTSEEPSQFIFTEQANTQLEAGIFSPRLKKLTLSLQYQDYLAGFLDNYCLERAFAYIYQYLKYNDITYSTKASLRAWFTDNFYQKAKNEDVLAKLVVIRAHADKEPDSLGALAYSWAENFFKTDYKKNEALHAEMDEYLNHKFPKRNQEFEIKKCIGRG